MTTVFDRARAVLHRDPNVSIPATYRQDGRGAGTPVRIIRDVASDRITSFDRALRISGGKQISVLAADCNPQEGDTWTLDDGTILTAQDAERTAEGSSYLVTVA